MNEPSTISATNGRLAMRGWPLLQLEPTAARVMRQKSILRLLNGWIELFLEAKFGVLGCPARIRDDLRHSTRIEEDGRQG